MNLANGLTMIEQSIRALIGWCFRQRVDRRLRAVKRGAAGYITLCLLAGVTGAAYAQIDLGGGAIRSEFGHGNASTASEDQKTLSNNLSLEGTYAYNISGGTVRLQAQTVVNRRSGGTSGSLRIELWAFATPYSGGSATGYKVGQSSVLSPLSAGFQYSNIDQTVAQLATPPNGTWYMYLFVTEYTASSLNNGYSFVDWGAFSSPWIIGAFFPDLVVINVAIGTHSTFTNQRIASQSTTVRNDGNATAAAGARIRFYWSTNTVISTADTYSGWYCDLGSLAPGQSTTCAGEVDAPATAGTYYFGAFVNEDGAIPESSFANNTGYDPVPVSVAASTSTTVSMVEFYNPAFDYYFITSRPAEVALLDSVSTFVRTGQSFKVYAQPNIFLGRQPITRFYFDRIALGGGRGSHFYTLVQSELNALTSLNPFNIAAPRLPYNEGIDSYAFLPIIEGVGGYCAGGLIPVFRIFRGNARFPDNPNHRFTTNVAIYNAFVAGGWDGEGVKFCVPA